MIGTSTLLILITAFNIASLAYFANRVANTEHHEWQFRSAGTSSPSPNAWIDRKEMCFFYRGFIKGGIETANQLSLLLKKERQLNNSIDTQKALHLIFSLMTKSISEGMSYLKEKKPSKDASSSSWIDQDLLFCDDILMKSSSDSYFSTNNQSTDFNADKIINNRQALIISKKEIIESEKMDEELFNYALENGKIDAFLASYLTKNSTF